MNIMLINHYAGSVRHGMEYRPYYMAREWVRMGHSVHIIAGSESHVRTVAPSLQGCDRLQETIDGVNYTWFALPPYRGNGIARVRNIMAFVMRLSREAKNLARNFSPEVVIASSTYPLDIFPARRIATLVDAQLIFELHDLWPLSPMELGGYSRWHPFMMLLQAAENYACRHANAVVSMLPKVAQHLEAHGMANHKLHIIPNGADPEEWSQDLVALPGLLADCIASLQASGHFIVAYAGSHGTANALGDLIDAARLLRNHPVAFLLVGAGPEKSVLEQRARALGLSKVRFFDPITKRQMPTFLHRIDVAYIGWQRQPLYRFGISPNKLIDYMMAGRPILHAVEAGNDLVSEACCGKTVPPENPRAVAESVLSLFELTPDERAAMGQRGRRFALDHLSYPMLSRSFMQVISGDVNHG